MKYSLIIFIGGLCGLSSLVLGSYDAYGTHSDSYAASPVHVHQPHGHGGGGHNAGSYYHYHVPLVGQQQPHYHPPAQHQDNSLHHILWPLLLLLALPLLFLPLLPLLLLPIGLSLLALLMPMMMMGMMMMMMMMGGMMPPMMKRSLESNEMRTLGELLLGDVSTLAVKYARSIDLDKCPERIACEIGVAAFPENASRTKTAKSFMNYIVDNAIPKGRTKRFIRQCREALWAGSKSGNCTVYHCQPAFRFANDVTTAKSKQGHYVTNTTSDTAGGDSYAYYNPYQQQYGTSSNSKIFNYTTNYNNDLASATAYSNYYGQNVEDNEVRGSSRIYSAFGTPVVKI